MVVEIQVWQVYAAWGLMAAMLLALCVMAVTIKWMYRNEYILRNVIVNKHESGKNGKKAQKECRTK